MCGRFTFHDDDAAIREWLDSTDHEPIQPSFNFAPTQQIPVIVADEEGARQLVRMRWGLIPSWAKEKKIGNKLINARAETVASKPAFRAAFRKRRCLVPMSGYYEWRLEDGRKQPYYVHGKGPVAGAGLWETWRDPETEEQVESCAILTTDATPELRELHLRMPLFIPPPAHRLWLDRQTPLEVVSGLIVPWAAPLMMSPVSKRLNNPRNNGPELLEPDRA